VKEKIGSFKDLEANNFNTIFSAIMRKFEEYRLEVYQSVMKTQCSSREARRNMLKAYITFATDQANLKAEKTFGDIVQGISDDHGDNISKMARGDVPDSVEIDPRTKA
jgi:hypothetical protein